MRITTLLMRFQMFAVVAGLVVAGAVVALAFTAVPVAHVVSDSGTDWTLVAVAFIGLLQVLLVPIVAHILTKLKETHASIGKVQETVNGHTSILENKLTASRDKVTALTGEKATLEADARQAAAAHVASLEAQVRAKDPKK